MAKVPRFVAIGAAAVMFAAIPGVERLSSASSAGKVANITIDGLQFRPADVTVAVGDTVVWTNKDPFPHNVKSEAGGFHSKDLDPDRSFRFRAAKAGDFPYVCTLHPTMRAVIHVK